MKSVWGHFIFIVIVGTLSSCGNVALESRSFKIGDKTAEQYYRQFVYRNDGSGSLPYHYLSRGFSKLKKIDNKENLYYSASLFLREDGNFVLDYEEWQGEEPSGGMTSLRPVFRTRKRGAWRVSETSLVLDGVGNGSALDYNNQPSVVVKFGVPLNAPELKNQSALFSMVQANVGLVE